MSSDNTSDDQGHAAAIAARAQHAHVTGDLAAAARLYEQLVTLVPDNAKVLANFAALRLQQDAVGLARTLAERAFALAPEDPDVLALAGELLRRSGDVGRARAFLSNAIRAKPALVSALFNLGLLERDANNTVEAARCFGAYVTVRPGDARVRTELGRLAYGSGDYEGARKWFSEQLRLFPDGQDVAIDLAVTHMAKDEWRDALLVLQSITIRLPPERETRRQVLLGDAQTKLGELRLALAAYQAAAGLAPENVEALLATARAHASLADLPSAISAFERVLRVDARNAPAANDLGVALVNLGNCADGIAHLRNAVSLDPQFDAAADNLLMALHYVDTSAEALFGEHVAWGERFPPGPDAAAARHRLSRPRSTGRVRIGYVSPRLNAGPLARFLLPVLERHDSAKFEVFCFATSFITDAVTSRMRSCVDHWIDAAGTPADALARRIADEGLDLLIDLAGHTPGNSLATFARCPAPVQATWLDYVNTTGLHQMQFLISDHDHSPVDGPQRFTERIVRHPYGRLCYSPFPSLPAVARPPMLARGHVTYGSFNRLSKISPAVFGTWASILKRDAKARLVLKASSLASEESRVDVLKRFVELGIAPERVELKPFTNEADYLAEYAGVDVMLDPFPFNGGTTTLDALSLGVPTISLVGSSIAGRQGYAILRSVGIADQWCAKSVDEYVDFAASIGGRANELLHLRTELPAMLRHAPVCNAVEYTRALEAIFLEIAET